MPISFFFRLSILSLLISQYLSVSNTLLLRIHKHFAFAISSIFSIRLWLFTSRFLICYLCAIVAYMNDGDIDMKSINIRRLKYKGIDQINIYCYPSPSTILLFFLVSSKREWNNTNAKTIDFVFKSDKFFSFVLFNMHTSRLKIQCDFIN